jgi:hypothetical protein
MGKGARNELPIILSEILVSFKVKSSELQGDFVPTDNPNKN